MRSTSSLSSAGEQASPNGAARSLAARARIRILGIAPGAVTFAARRFRGAGERPQRHLERIGAAFLTGYQAALLGPSPAALAEPLSAVERDFRGFAFEGASMALALLDGLLPWTRSRLRAFVDETARRHVYMAYVGAGWAWARLRRSPGERRAAALHPLLGWLAVDGFGFHQGYFAPGRFVDEAAPPRLRGYAARAFDQGLGRSLWFVEGAGVERIAARIGRFEAGRRADLWSGVGLACAYAGGVGAEDVRRLLDASGEHAAHVAQGMVFAAEARARAEIATDHTDIACRVALGRSAEWAAALAVRALRDLPDGASAEPRYERWRGAIRDDLAEVVG